MRTKPLRSTTLSWMAGLVAASAVSAYSQTIVYPSQGSHIEAFAAKEVRRYIFLRTGTAPVLAKVTNSKNLPAGDVIVVAENSRPIITELKKGYGNVNAPVSGDRKGYLIKSVRKDGRDVLTITGADGATTLNAAYRFAELLGCYFNLSGDIIPDAKIAYPINIA